MTTSTTDGEATPIAAEGSYRDVCVKRKCLKYRSLKKMTSGVNRYVDKYVYLFGNTDGGNGLTTAVRATKAAKQTLEELARELGEPQTAVLDRAIRLLKTHMKFERGRAAYAELRRDEKAWSEFKSERDAWDTAPLDGPLDGPLAE